MTTPDPTESTIRTCFGRRSALVGMVHVRALPGSPRASLTVDEIIEIAADEARTLADHGVDAVIIENMHDTPYVHGDQLGPEQTAIMTRAAIAVRGAAPDVPLGVQVLSGGNKQALAIALASGASFIRCENFVYAHVADEGLLAQAEAGHLLRYRKSIGAEHIAVICDIKKKHASQALTADISIAEAAHAAEFFCADGLIVTGSTTGAPTSPDDVRAVREASSLPVLVGSGVTPENIAGLVDYADAFIVGSALKRDGVWSNGLDPDRIRLMVEAVRQARGG